MRTVLLGVAVLVAGALTGSALASDYGKERNVTCEYRPAGVNEVGERVDLQLDCEEVTFTCRTPQSRTVHVGILSRDFKYSIDGVVKEQHVRRTFKEFWKNAPKKDLRIVHDDLLNALLARKVVSWKLGRYGGEVLNVSLHDSWLWGRGGIEDAKRYRREC